MKERPIIFSGPMVRAILDGRKIQTRRVARLNASGRVFRGHRNWHPHDEAAVLACFCQPGDRLYVREAFRQAWPATSYSEGIVYRADAARSLGMDEYSDRHRWKPSIHMPKKYARLWLEVAGVRVERLTHITPEDCLAEGITTRLREYDAQCDLVGQFRNLWDGLNAKRGYGWDSNPWVWVIEFQRVPTSDSNR